MNIYEKLMTIQQELKAPKSQYNKFGDFHYRSCEDIQEAVKPLLAKAKTVLLISDEILQIGDRFYIKATAKLQDTESPECVTNAAYAREAGDKPKMDAAQITGSCSSYARKYALNGLFCIDDAKDPDCPQGQQGTSAAKPPQGQQGKARQQGARGISAAELASLRREADRTGTPLILVCKRYLVDRVENLTPEQYLAAMRVFEQMPDVPPPEPGGQYAMDFSGMEAEMPFR
ncbi:MAG: ERF family protein [Lachnospiraceae bacterium]|nr:ERF family protein [Lachnospiraceae bacterium]MCI9660915.1 ERF family protein [Lachnospiraceae bacterium]